MHTCKIILHICYIIIYTRILNYVYIQDDYVYIITKYFFTHINLICVVMSLQGHRECVDIVLQKLYYVLKEMLIMNNKQQICILS